MRRSVYKHCRKGWKVEKVPVIKGTVPRDFRLLFFHESVSPKHWVYYKGRFKFFRKFAEIFTAQGSPPVLLTPMANEKIFNQKKFNNFVGTPLDSRVNIYINFYLQVHFKVSAADIVPIVCHRCRWHWQQIIVDTGGKFATGINNTSETGGKICRRCPWYRWCTLTCE